MPYRRVCGTPTPVVTELHQTKRPLGAPPTRQTRRAAQCRSWRSPHRGVAGQVCTEPARHEELLVSVDLDGREYRGDRRRSSFNSLRGARLLVPIDGEAAVTFRTPPRHAVRRAADRKRATHPIQRVASGGETPSTSPPRWPAPEGIDQAPVQVSRSRCRFVCTRSRRPLESTSKPRSAPGTSLDTVGSSRNFC